MPRKPRRIALMLDLQWPYKRHTAIFAGTQKFADEQGWHSIIDEFADETLSARRLKAAPYDGIIARANHALLKQARRWRVPVVNVWANSPVRDELAGVFPDYTIVGQQCAEHLLNRGFRRFATLVPPKNCPQELVVREFMRVVQEAGGACVAETVPQSPSRSVADWRRTEQVLERCVASWKPPIGVYLADEGVGRLVVQACQRRGLRVPADVAIVAGQNDEPLCERPRPSLTSIEIGFERVGYEAARLLQTLMTDSRPKSTPLLIPPLGLVVRESTDFHAVPDALVAAALRFISANCHLSIGQNDVSQAVHAETRTLQMRFRKFLGRPIVAEIRRVRIERAKRELVHSEKRLSDIARDVGFGDPMRMYEVFRREIGVTPSAYRKRGRME